MIAQLFDQGRRRGFKRLAASAAITLGVAFGLAAPAGAIEIDDPRQIEPVSPGSGTMGVAGAVAAGQGQTGTWRTHALRSPARSVSPDGKVIGWIGTGRSAELQAPDNYMTQAVSVRTSAGWQHMVASSAGNFDPNQLAWSGYFAMGDQFDVAIGTQRVESEWPLRPAYDVDLEDGVFAGPWPHDGAPATQVRSYQSFSLESRKGASLERGGLPLNWPFTVKSPSSAGDFPHAVGNEIFFSSPNQLSVNAPVASPTFANNSPLHAYVRPISDGAPEYIGQDAAGNPSAASGVVSVSPDGRRVLLRVTDAGNVTRVLLWDRDADTRTIMGEGPSAVDSSGGSFEFSSDGSAVMIYSATRLMDSDTDSRRDVYRYDIAADELVHVSVDLGNGIGNSSGGATCGGVSQCHVNPIGANADGSIIYFASGEQFEPGGPNGRNQVFRWDLAKLEANEPAFEALPVAFGNSVNTPGHVVETGDVILNVTSSATVDLPEWADHGLGEVLFYSAGSHETTCLVCAGAQYLTTINAFGSLDQPATILGTVSARPFSDNGDFVAVTTDAPLSPSDQNGAADVYLFQTRSGVSTRISEGSGSRGAQFAAMNADGSKVFFVSNSSLGANQGVYLPGPTRMYVSDTDLDSLVRPADPEDRVSECGFNCRSLNAGEFDYEPASGREQVGGNIRPDQPKADRRMVVRASQTRGARVVLRLRLPAVGRVKVSGTRIRRVGRRVGAGHVNVGVRLKSRHRAQLRRRGRLATTVRVRFKPRDGVAINRAVRVKFITSSRNGGR